MTTSTYTISTNKVPISLAEFVKVLPTCEYMLIQGLSTLGGLVLLIQMFHLQWLQLDIYHNKVSTILMEAFPLYKSIGPAAANFFQEHITYQFGSPHKITNNKLNSIHWSTVISSCGNPTLPFQSLGSPTHYIIGIMVVLCITPLESLQRHHQSCNDLTLGGLVFHSYNSVYERTTHRSTWRPTTPPIKSRLLLQLWNFLLQWISTCLAIAILLLQ